MSILATNFLIVLCVFISPSCLDAKSSAHAYHQVARWYKVKQLRNPSVGNEQGHTFEAKVALTQVFISIAWCKRIVARAMVLMGVPKVKTSMSESLYVCRGGINCQMCPWTQGLGFDMEIIKYQGRQVAREERGGGGHRHLCGIGPRN